MRVQFDYPRGSLSQLQWQLSQPCPYPQTLGRISMFIKSVKKSTYRRTILREYDPEFPETRSR
jgi:hypothetical protein